MKTQDSFWEMAEQQVLFYLDENRGRVVSRAELVLNPKIAVSRETLDSIIASLEIKKLIEVDAAGNLAAA